MQQPVAVDAAASCSTLLSSPLLSSYFYYVWQQFLLFVLPMMKLTKAKAAAALFPLSSPLLSSLLFCR
jgi:hypothetical protein